MNFNCSNSEVWLKNGQWQTVSLLHDTSMLCMTRVTMESEALAISRQFVIALLRNVTPTLMH